MSSAGGSLAAAREALASAYLRTGDYDRVEEMLEEAASEARAMRDRRAMAAAIALQGMLLHYRAIELPPEERAEVDWRPELELFERAFAIRREIGDVEGMAESAFQLGLVPQVLRRDLAGAAPYFREALELLGRQAAADAFLRSEVHRHLGFDLLLREARYDDGIEHLRISLELRSRIAERGWIASALVALAMASRVAGRKDEAATYARRALELARAEGLRERHVDAAESELRQAGSR